MIFALKILEKSSMNFSLFGTLYTVSWENGAQGTFVNNLQAGEYTATVTDYYGDYTETITCTVSNNTFYLDELINSTKEEDANICLNMFNARLRCYI